MDEKQLQALANELAKKLKTPEDLSQFDRLLKKLSVRAALNAEMTHYLGYKKNQSRPGTNSRNGYSTKTVITGDDPLVATAAVAIMGDAGTFRSEREFTAYIGLVPKQTDTGGRIRLRVSKRSDCLSEDIVYPRSKGSGAAD